MGQYPQLDKDKITRAGFYGALLGVVAILLFVGLWVGLGGIGVTVFPRLVISICIPPAVLSFVAGIFLIVKSPSAASRNPQSSASPREPMQE